VVEGDARRAPGSGRATVAIAINPIAGRGRAAAGREAEARLVERGIPVVAHYGASAADTEAFAERAVRDGIPVLVVVGGDGTVSTVLDAIDRVLVDAPSARLPAIGIVPAGTGDDLARALGIPLGDARAAADVAVDGSRRRIDSGVVEGAGWRRRFVTVAACGFDSRVAERTNRLRWPAGQWRYRLAIVVEVLRLAPTAFRVAVDGALGRAFAGTLVAVANTPSYGGGMPIAPGASAVDGLLDVVEVAAVGRLRLLGLLPRLVKGTHAALREVAIVRATSVEIDAPNVVVYADGERLGWAPVRIRVEPASLEVCVPAAEAGSVPATGSVAATAE